jgi:hypothetical protein
VALSIFLPSVLMHKSMYCFTKELEDLRVEVSARERLANFDESTAISMNDMRARYAKKDQ